MLGAYGEAHGAGGDALLGFLGVGELGMGGGGGVDDERLHVGHVGEQREYFQRVDEAVSLFLAPLYLKGEYRPCTVGELAGVESVVGVVGEGGMVDAGDLGMIAQELHDAQGILDMTFHAQRQRLKPL